MIQEDRLIASPKRRRRFGDAFCRGEMGADMSLGRSLGRGRMFLLEERHIFRWERVTTTVESLEV